MSYDGTTIVVTADPGALDYFLETRNMYAEARVQEAGFGGSIIDPVETLQHIIAKLLDLFFDKVVKTDEEKKEDEQKVAQMFDPAQIAAQGNGRAADGRTVHFWVMRDGTTFYDVNGNGTPDYMTKFGPAADELFGNDGTGWSQL